jgi:hypothetical protein
MAEVLRDNANQTIIPNIVEPEDLEKANGRICGAPRRHQHLRRATARLDAPRRRVRAPVLRPRRSTFFVAAAWWRSSPARSAPHATRTHPTPRRLAGRSREGVRWLWATTCCGRWRSSSACMNGAGMIAFATFVLFAQEVLGVGPLLFTVIGFGGAIGGLVGGTSRPWDVTAASAPGTCLGDHPRRLARSPLP